ncbi:MAG: GtrA family protein [Ruminococcus sp.]|jgi:putative flippase GtrA|uniref:GtrA family protein n=1 Tax=uncultured Ruminococcus sp. TaxID=165186 RepID=UPI002606342E|nr:GtrA family protein [uncultured Ruminococcus sp.]
MKKHDGAIAEETSTKNGGNFQEIVEIFRKGQLGRLFAGATENTLIQFFRYCFVGGAATIVDWGLSSLLFYFAFHQSYAVIANGLSFVAGLLANYFLSTFWVFRSSKIKSRLAEFMAFAAIGVVGLLLTIGITKLFEITMADVTSAYQIISKVVSTAVAFLWNFFARKYLIYSKKDEA